MWCGGGQKFVPTEGYRLGINTNEKHLQEDKLKQVSVGGAENSIMINTGDK